MNRFAPLAKFLAMFLLLAGCSRPVDHVYSTKLPVLDRGTYVAVGTVSYNDTGEWLPPEDVSAYIAVSYLEGASGGQFFGVSFRADEEQLTLGDGWKAPSVFGLVLDIDFDGYATDTKVKVLVDGKYLTDENETWYAWKADWQLAILGKFGEIEPPAATGTGHFLPRERRTLVELEEEAAYARVRKETP